MSKYKIEFRKEITMALGSQWANLDPADFLHCQDSDELEDCIMDVFYSNYYYEGDIDVYESETSLIIPDKFIKKWEELKNG